MEKEKTTNPEQNKKKHKKALLLLLLLLLAVVGVTVGAVVMTASNSGESDGRLYYNVDYLQYVGGDGLSTRELGGDGYYKVLLAVDGEQIEYKVEDKNVVDKIDSRDLMGLSIDRKGVITDVFEPQDVTGGEAVSKWYVASLDDTSVTVSDTGEEDGLSYTLKLTENTGIYDITRVVEPIGKSTTLQKGDCIRAFKDLEGGIKYIFKVIPDGSVFQGSTHEKYCEHCKKEVTWYEWEETDTLPTTAGHWCIMNDVQLVRRQVIAEPALCVLDLNGKTIDGGMNQRILSVYYNSATLAIIDQSESKTGTMRTHGNVKGGGIVFVEQGSFELYSGTLDASDVDCDYKGLAIRTARDTTATMYGGTVIGGVSRCVILGSGGKEGGAGGSVFVGTHSTFTLKGGTIRDGVVETHTYPNKSRTFGLGGNIYIQDFATFVMEGGTVSGGKAGNQGGNIYLEKTAVATITGGEIKDGHSDFDGGNVMSHNGATLTITGITISNGVAEKSNGGNVCVTNKTILEMSDVTLVSGKGFRGGNLCVWKDAKKATVKNVVMKNGVATKEGGNLVVWGKAKLDISGSKMLNGTAGFRGGNIQCFGDINMTGCTVSGGKVSTFTDPTTKKVSKGFGGNVYIAKFTETKDGVKSYFNGNVNMTNTTVTGGKVPEANGGNFYVEGKGNLVLGSNTAVENGSAANAGGNIFAQGEAKITVKTTRPIQNGTAKSGGNIYLGKTTFDMVNGTIKNGVATYQGGNMVAWGYSVVNMTGGTITNGEAVVRGGNIVCLGTMNIKGGVISNGKVTTEKNNNENGLGGNIYQAVYVATEKDAAGNSIKVPYRSTITMTDGTLTNGVSEHSRGGNIYVSDRADFIVSGKSVIEKGVAKVNGGNLFAQAGSTITLNDGVVVKDGTAGSDGGNAQIGSKGVLTVNNATVTNGKAKQGANIAIANGTVTIQGANALVNNGKATNGGNIYSTGVLVIKDGLIDKGVASNIGGNICHTNAKKEVTFTMSGGKVTAGSAKRGGNLYVGNDTTSVINNATITDGVATTDGGNIANWSRTDMTIGGNTVVARGIGPNRGANITSLGNLTLNDKCVIGDETVLAEAKIGANIYIASYVNSETKEVVQSTFTMNGGTIRNGKAFRDDATETEAGKEEEENGGNIYAKDHAKVVLNGGTIQNGVATSRGGNIYIRDNASITMNAGNIIAGSAAVHGGNIYVTNECNMEMNGGSITGGVATTDGGNIAVWSKGSLTVTGDALISKGTASNRGGDIFALGNVTIKDNAVIGDAEVESTAKLGGNIYIASYLKSGVLDTKSTLTMEGGTIQNGSASTSGGCVHAQDQADIIMTNGALITSGRAHTGTSNSAGIGGNIMIVKGALDVTNSTISNGTSVASRGGNVYVRTAKMYLRTGAVVSGGTSKYNGGNFMTDGAGCEVQILGATVTGGTSTNADGGNIRIGSNCILTISNVAGENDSVITATVSNGKAANLGGNIAADNTSVININGATITEGSAKTGGNIQMQGSSMLNINGAAITNGKATSNGGNIYADSGVRIRFEGGLVTITGGLKGTAANNMYLNAPSDARHVTLINDLEDGSSIGITLSRNGYFTDKKIADQKNHVGYFVPDVATKKVIYGPDAGFTELGIRCQNK